MIFNFTQPAEDAVDEALTGLKSALAVKIYGEDLQVLEEKAVEIKRILSASSRLHRADRRARTGPAQRADRCGSRKNRALRHQCIRRRRRDPGRRRRAGRDASHSRRTAVRFGRAHEAPVPLQHAEHRQSARAHAVRPTSAHFRACQHHIRETALRSSIAKIIRGTSACSSASRAATWRARWTTPRKLCASRWCCRRVTRSTGVANTANTSRHGEQFAIIGPLAHFADLHDSFRAVRQPEIPGHRDDRRGDDGAGGRIDRPETHAHAVQRQLRARPARVDGGFGRDRRDPGVLHQQTAPGKSATSAQPRAKRRCCGCGPS